MRAVRAIGDKFLALAEEQHKPVIVLAGRPYHVDPEINHGIDGLICDCGAVVVTEDAVACKEKKFPTKVLNQWTYHSRLYAAAKYVVDRADKRVNLIQLVSFGFGALGYIPALALYSVVCGICTGLLLQVLLPLLEKLPVLRK